MSGIKIQQPVFQEALRCHRIPVIAPHDQFSKIATAEEVKLDPIQDCSGLFHEFVQGFLTQAAPYFSKPLPAAIFIQRIVHEWDCGEWTEEDLTFPGRARICWAPVAIDFYSHSYTLHWKLMDVEILETPPVQSEELAPAPPPAAPAPPAPPAPSPLEEVAVPYHPPNQHQRERMKQKVRRARLRAAIAHLRAEKMAERYYMRYGLEEENESGSDSDLTFASETESAKI